MVCVKVQRTGGGMAPTLGDSVRVVGLNCNCVGQYQTQVNFINKIKSMSEDIFVLYDTRLAKKMKKHLRVSGGEKPFLIHFLAVREVLLFL